MLLKRSIALSILLGLCAAAKADPLTTWSFVDPYNRLTLTNPDPQTVRLDERGRSSKVGPAWVVSDFTLAPVAQFTVTARVTRSNSDDDFFGIAFGYQDNDNFYLMDWKRARQRFNWRDATSVADDTAEAGLKLKKIDDGWTRDGLWGGTDGDGVSTLAGPVAGRWSPRTVYTFDVSLSPGRILIRRDGVTVFDVADTTFTGGRIAFYGFSQDNIEFTMPAVNLPEPATAAALVLGALVLLSRRRRSQ